MIQPKPVTNKAVTNTNGFKMLSEQRNKIVSKRDKKCNLIKQLLSSITEPYYSDLEWDPCVPTCTCKYSPQSPCGIAATSSLVSKAALVSWGWF